MSDLLDQEAEVSSGSDSESEHGREKPTKKRAVIDSDDEEEGLLFYCYNKNGFLIFFYFCCDVHVIATNSTCCDVHVIATNSTCISRRGRVGQGSGRFDR